jgi:hypothetical protein
MLGPASQPSQTPKPNSSSTRRKEREDTPEIDLPSLRQIMAPASQFNFSNTTLNLTSSNPTSQVINLDSSPPVARTMAPPPRTKQGTLDSLPKTKAKGKEGKKYIMLRDSLPGGWKMVDEDEEGGGVREEGRGKGKGKGKKWRMSEVQVLDLTGD